MKKIVITSDLGFGDCGKGTIVSSLCQKLGATTALVVRYNGGAQACHTVETNGMKHQFHMFGSGTLDGADTLLSHHTLVDPIVIYQESAELSKKLGHDVCDYLYIDPECLVTTTYHKLVNRAREIFRGSNKHGSCGMGIGATVEYNDYTPEPIKVKDLLKGSSDLEEKLKLNQEWACWEIVRLNQSPADCLSEQEFKAQLDIFPKIIQRHTIVNDADFLFEFREDPIIFEASQGILLDQDWGFHPHTTWSKTTAHNAYDLLKAADISRDEVENIGIMRAYQTRHGAGPLPTETQELDIQDINNPTNNWQDNFRIGYLDLPLTSYAIHANGGIDSLAVTCFDQIKGKPLKMCMAYDHRIKHDQPGDLKHLEAVGKLLNKVQPMYMPLYGDNEYLEIIEEVLEKSISILSMGPETTNKEFFNYQLK